MKSDAKGLASLITKLVKDTRILPDQWHKNVEQAVLLSATEADFHVSHGPISYEWFGFTDEQRRGISFEVMRRMSMRDPAVGVDLKGIIASSRTGNANTEPLLEWDNDRLIPAGAANGLNTPSLTLSELCDAVAGYKRRHEAGTAVPPPPDRRLIQMVQKLGDGGFDSRDILIQTLNRMNEQMTGVIAKQNEPKGRRRTVAEIQSQLPEFSGPRGPVTWLQFRAVLMLLMDRTPDFSDCDWKHTIAGKLTRAA